MSRELSTRAVLQTIVASLPAQLEQTYAMLLESRQYHRSRPSKSRRVAVNP